jgi:hypothetical protein
LLQFVIVSYYFLEIGNLDDFRILQIQDLFFKLEVRKASNIINHNKAIFRVILGLGYIFIKRNITLYGFRTFEETEYKYTHYQLREAIGRIRCFLSIYFHTICKNIRIVTTAGFEAITLNKL